MSSSAACSCSRWSSSGSSGSGKRGRPDGHRDRAASLRGATSQALPSPARPGPRPDLPRARGRAGLFLGPFFWIVTTSLKGNEDFFAFPPVWIPAEPSLAHYTRLFTNASGGRYFANSLVISTLSMAAALGVHVPTAYTIARGPIRVGFLDHTR